MCKSVYVLYAVPQYLIFLFFNLLYLLPMFFKGFFVYSLPVSGIVTSSEYLETVTTENINYQKVNRSRIVGKAFVWLFIGIPLLFWAVIRDSYHFWAILYVNNKKQERKPEATKFEQILDVDFIKNMHKTLESIQQEEVTVTEFYES